MTHRLLAALLLASMIPTTNALAGYSAGTQAIAQRSVRSFAAPDVVPLNIGGGTIIVQFAPGEYSLPRSEYVRWVSTAARSVTRYFGRFPIKKLIVKLSSTRGSNVAFSTAGFEDDQPVIEIPIGRNITAQRLFKSWEATHEMVHLAFPMVGSQYRWLKEGMATYVEPIARLQNNDLTAAKVWSDLYESCPGGLADNDAGLKEGGSIDRIYWGGAVFCLVADCEIRRKTNNQRGLQDALAAIPAAGGNFESDWSTLKALREGDRAIGVKVLEPLFQEMHNQPSQVSLTKYWKLLGVRQVGDQIVFDDGAPWASVRLSINSGRPVSPTR